jgi:hypothetical protein
MEIYIYIYIYATDTWQMYKVEMPKANPTSSVFVKAWDLTTSYNTFPNAGGIALGRIELGLGLG